MFGDGNGNGAGSVENDGGGNGFGSDSAAAEQVGVGRRRLPDGVHGAHGSFNRVQWRLDGQAVLVDELGRTESEAGEEEKAERGGAAVEIADVAVEGEGETSHSHREEDVELEFLDRHLGIKPKWLLKFFTSWGARWSAVATNATGGTTTLAEATDDFAAGGTSVAADEAQCSSGMKLSHRNGSENEVDSEKADEQHILS